MCLLFVPSWGNPPPMSVFARPIPGRALWLCVLYCAMRAPTPYRLAQALNKSSGEFTSLDERHLKLFGTLLGNTLVKAKLHETAK